MDLFNHRVRQLAGALQHGFRLSQLYNRLLYEVQAALRWRKCTYQPIWLHLYVSSRCNFRCRFCTNQAANDAGKVPIGYHAPVDNMTMDTFRAVLSRFDRAMVCTLCGVGEPFLNPHLLEMLTYAHGKRMVTEVVTNGSLLSSDRAAALLDIPLDRITISLLETDTERHQQIADTKRQFLPQVIGNVRAFIEERVRRGAKTEVKLSRVLTRRDLSRARDFIECAIAIGADTVVFNNLIVSEMRDFEDSQCLFDDEDTRRFFAAIESEYGNTITLRLPILIKRARKDKRPHCNWYWKNLSVDAAGNVSGCGRFITPKAEYGRFNDTEVWNASHFTSMRDSFRENAILDCCASCVESST